MGVCHSVSREDVVHILLRLFFLSVCPDRTGRGGWNNRIFLAEKRQMEQWIFYGREE